MSEETNNAVKALHDAVTNNIDRNHRSRLNANVLQNQYQLLQDENSSLKKKISLLENENPLLKDENSSKQVVSLGKLCKHQKIPSILNKYKC